MRSRVQPKGQVTIPKEARDELGLRAGDEIIWVKNHAGRWEIWRLDELGDSLFEDSEDVKKWLAATRGHGPQAV